MSGTGVGEALRLAEAELRDALAEGAPAVVVNEVRARVLELQARLRDAQTASSSASPGRWEPLSLHPAQPRVLPPEPEPRASGPQPADPELEFRRRVEAAVATAFGRRRRRSKAMRALWSTGQAELTITARLVVARDKEFERLPLVRIESFPRADLVPEFLRRFAARRQDGEFAGVKAVRCEGDDVVLELDHPLFASCTADELDRSGIVRWRHRARLEVRAPTGVMTMSVAEVISRFVDSELTHIAGTTEDHATLVRAAVEAETLVVALELLEPVLLAMRPSLDDREAIDALMHFIRPEHRAVIDALPHRPSHPYTEGFTEAQARRLVAHRKLRARSRDFALQDWATAMEALAEVAQARAEASSRLREALSVARLRLVRRDKHRWDWTEVARLRRAARG